jgi:hypothetical protein
MRYITTERQVKLICASYECQNKSNEEATFYPEVHQVDTTLGPAFAYNPECPDCDRPGMEIT